MPRGGGNAGGHDDRNGDDWQPRDRRGPRDNDRHRSYNNRRNAAYNDNNNNNNNNNDDHPGYYGSHRHHGNNNNYNNNNNNYNYGPDQGYSRNHRDDTNRSGGGRYDDRRRGHYGGDGHYGGGDGHYGGGHYGGGREGNRYHPPGGGGGRNPYHGNSGGNRGGGNEGYRDRGGRGGGYNNGNRGRGGGGRGGRGGRGGGRRSPDMSGITSCLSNVMLADVAENFQFFLYSVAVKNDQGGPIESRHRRKFLFDLGLWNGLFKDVPDKERDDLRRVVFYQGSFFYSARKIPGLEPDKLPLELPVSHEAEGDSIKVVQVFHYVTPVELLPPVPAPPTPLDGSKDGDGAATQANKADELRFDMRCSDCTRCFKDVGALLQHCQSASHAPVYPAEDTAASGCEPVPANMDVFNSYINGALQRALGERLARWGTEYIDPKNMKEPVDRQNRPLGVRVYEAYSCQFGFFRNDVTDRTRVGLTVDLRAKIVRTLSVLDNLANFSNQDPGHYNPTRQEQDRARRTFIGEVVISMHDKKCYSVTDLVFQHSANSLVVEGLGISHAQYFAQRKGIQLRYPNATPMIAALGRRNQTIFLPPELVAGNELEARVKQQLPMIASYKPDSRNEAIDKIRSYLVPGAQKSKTAGDLLPALGIQLADGRLSAKARVLPTPMLKAAGVPIPPSKGENWAPFLNRADFKIEPNQSNMMQVIVFYNQRIRGAMQVYNRIRNFVNKFNATYRFSDTPTKIISVGDMEAHWREVERCFSDPSLDPENVFVLDFNKPRGATDSAYPVIKQMLAKSGFLSQFVNFNTYDHAGPKDQHRSDIILNGVARQILQKTGFRLWWVNIPRSLPTPTVFIGVDVFHAPRVYDPKEKKRVAKASCAAIIVQVFRNSGEQKAQQVELFTKTYARESGKEYELGDALQETVVEAMKELSVKPTSCIVWRDGIGDSAFNNAAQEEINAIRAGLNQTVDGEEEIDIPLSYIVAQKRISTKFLSEGIPGETDGKYGAPSGTLVKGIQSHEHETFYLNGRSPPYSTPKPVRFVIIDKDPRLNEVPIEELTWNLSHDYPNWTGPIKVPSVTQMAHKLAEVGGSFPDCGKSINARKLKNKIHFL